MYESKLLWAHFPRLVFVFYEVIRKLRDLGVICQLIISFHMTPISRKCIQGDERCALKSSISYLTLQFQSPQFQDFSVMNGGEVYTKNDVTFLRATAPSSYKALVYSTNRTFCFLTFGYTMSYKSVKASATIFNGGNKALTPSKRAREPLILSWFVALVLVRYFTPLAVLVIKAAPFASLSGLSATLMPNLVILMTLLKVRYWKSLLFKSLAMSSKFMLYSRSAFSKRLNTLLNNSWINVCEFRFFLKKNNLMSSGAERGTRSENTSDSWNCHSSDGLSHS